MNEYNSQKNQTLKILGIGMFLVLLVSFATLSRYVQQKRSGNDKTASFEEIKEINAITSEDLQKKITGGEALVLIDLRDNESFQKEHLLGSINIPYVEASDYFSARKETGKTYVVLDSGEAQDAKALVSDLFSRDIKNVYFLKDGFIGWKFNFGATISYGDPESFTDQAKVNYISSDELKKAIEQNSNIYVIDVRKSPSYAEGHIKGAVNIFLDNIEEKRKEIPLGKTIVVYDNDGLWAFMAAVRLFDSGVINVLSLSDGLNKWKEKGYEIEK